MTITAATWDLWPAEGEQAAIFERFLEPGPLAEDPNTESMGFAGGGVVSHAFLEWRRHGGWQRHFTRVFGVAASWRRPNTRVLGVAASWRRPFIRVFGMAASHPVWLFKILKGLRCGVLPPGSRRDLGQPTFSIVGRLGL